MRFVGCSEIVSARCGKIKLKRDLIKKEVLYQRILVKLLAELQSVVPSESTRKLVELTRAHTHSAILSLYRN